MNLLSLINAIGRQFRKGRFHCPLFCLFVMTESVVLRVLRASVVVPFSFRHSIVIRNLGV